jgi:hypothetical protein
MTRELSQRAAGSSKAIISEYIAELHYPSDLHDVRVAQ